MTEYLDTPISWGDSTLNHFIPKEFEKQTVFLQSPEFATKKQYEGSIVEELERVLHNPLGYNMSFDELVKEKYQKGKPIIFAVDDYTRPNKHTRILLPLLIQKVLSLGVTKEDILILIASGTHRVSKDAEVIKIVGEGLAKEYKDQIISHDCEKDITPVGTSKAGTPMAFDSRIFDCSLLVPVTDSELHYFAGVAGTIKEICPGIASKETVSRNHPKMFDKELGFVPGCRLGNADETNPVISDIKDMVKILKEKVTIFGVDAIVTDGEIVVLAAGDLIELHEKAVKTVVPMRTVKIPKAGDLVITGLQTWGVNLYQAGKGIHAAWNAVRKDGKGEILILGPCPDGVGNANYEKTMQDCVGMPIDKALEFVIDNYCSIETFKIGNQKPVDVLRILKTVGDGNLKMISEMDGKQLLEENRIVPLMEKGGDPLETLRKEVKEVLEKNPDAQIYLLDDPGLNIVVE